MGRAALIWLLIASASPLYAADQLTLVLGDLSGEGWQVKGAALNLGLSADGDQFQLQAEEIQHPVLSGSIHGFRYRCLAGKLQDDRIQCTQGEMDLQFGDIKQTRVSTSIDWQIDRQQVAIKFANLSLAGGTISLALQLQQQHWAMQLKAEKITLEQLSELPFGDLLANDVIEYAGQANIELAAKGKGNQLQSVNGHMHFHQLEFADGKGDNLGQGLNGQWQGAVSFQNGMWQGEQRLQLDAGELLTPYFYLSGDTGRSDLETRFTYHTETHQLDLEQVRFSHDERVKMEGQLSLINSDSPQLRRLNLRLHPTEIGRIFRDHLLPVSTNPRLSQLKLDGRLGLDLEYDKQTGSQLDLRLDALNITQSGVLGEDLAIQGLNGDVHWFSGSAPVQPSVLSWQQGRLLNTLPIGGAELHLSLQGDGAELLQPVNIPVLDGGLTVEALQLAYDEQGPGVQFQGYVTPISMQSVSQALDWPPLSGRLSGMIPKVTYQNGVIDVDGIVLIKLFGGEILIKNLQLDDLFSALPSLNADLEMKRIDLETLTQTFSFGKITGKLDGQVDQLRLESWQPVSFDARIYTPQDDESRHRISQKAVDNLSNLGGSGVSGAISRSFLRFFEEFGYDRLGLSCRLRRGICEMAGIEEAENGYYLVKGGGIPRIDIVGFNRRTDWQQLVSKLKQIADGGTPIIE